MAESFMDLAGKVALVTGAAHGIGAATARELHDLGASVVLLDLSHTSAEKLRSTLDESRTIVVRGDVSVPEDVARAVDAAVEVFGGLDILINNAATGSAARVEELEPDDWKRVVDVSLGGVLNGIKFAAPRVRDRGGGSIVNLSSIAARHAMYAMASYAAAKSAVEAVTRCAAIELRPDNIRVNAVAPGMIRSRGSENSMLALQPAMIPSVDDWISDRQGRWGEATEVASVIAHLASSQAGFVTGQTHVVDNGATLLI